MESEALAMTKPIDIFPTPVLSEDEGQLTLLFPGNVLGVSLMTDSALEERVTQALIRAWNSSLLAFQREAWNIFTSGTRVPGAGWLRRSEDVSE